MSKKTQNIYKAISNLEEIQKQLESILHQKDLQENWRELDNMQFEMKQNLRELKFWIESLYLYNGKSTSRAKQSSSRENGKKGGRPPKEISLARKRIAEIDGEFIPQIEQKLKFGDDMFSDEQLQSQLEKFRDEKSVLEQKIIQWADSRKM